MLTCGVSRQKEGRAWPSPPDSAGPETLFGVARSWPLIEPIHVIAPAARGKVSFSAERSDLFWYCVRTRATDRQAGGRHGWALQALRPVPPGWQGGLLRFGAWFRRPPGRRGRWLPVPGWLRVLRGG